MRHASSGFGARGKGRWKAKRRRAERPVGPADEVVRRHMTTWRCLPFAPCSSGSEGRGLQREARQERRRRGCRNLCVTGLAETVGVDPLVTIEDL